MQKLKNILQSNILYYILFVILIIYIITSTILIKYKSNYNIENNDFIGIIKDYKIDGDLLTITLKTKEEKIICFYKIKSLDEKYNLEETIKYGLTINVKGVLEEPKNNTIPNTFNYKKYLYNKKIYYILNVDDLEILKNENILYKSKNSINNYINKIDSTGYINALVLGNKNNIDKDYIELYQKNGISHLFAISGMHLSVFILIFDKILKRIIKSGKKRLLVIDILLIFYGFLIGFTSSILRAITFTILLSINKIFDFNISIFKSLLLTISLLIFVNPFIIYEVSFLYSVASSMAIILNTNKLKGNYISKIFKTSIITSIYCLPINIYYFKTYNILSIINNIFYIPFISLVIYPLCLITCIIPYLNHILKLLTNILEYISKLNNNYMSLNIYLYINIYLIFVYYFVLIIKHKIKYILLTILIICMYLKPYLDNNYYIYYLDVGQGDSTIIIYPHKKEVILIDTGGKKSYTKEDWQDKKTTKLSDNIVTFINSLGISKIDYLLLTHGDYDHMGEAINLVNNFKVENVILNNDEFNELETELIKVLENKKVKYYKGLKELNIGNDKLYFLNTKEYDNENDNSNVIYFKLNDYKFLFMGDAGVNREKDILDKYKLNEIDFIKIGHHGSNTSSSKYFIDMIKPKNCLISVGKNNRYGHPKDEVLNILDDYCDIYRTDINGSIEIKLNKNNYKIKTYSP